MYIRGIEMTIISAEPKTVFIDLCIYRSLVTNVTVNGENVQHHGNLNPAIEAIAILMHSFMTDF